MTEKLVDTENLLNIIQNNIIYYLQQFDKQLSLSEKKKTLDQLDRLLLKYETQNKKAKEEFYIASRSEKSQYKRALKESTKQYKKLCNDITERKNLYQVLSIRSTSFITPHLNIDLGEQNQHSLDYSKLKTVIKEAKDIYSETVEYLKELEQDIKEKPLIEQDDPAYRSYLNYMKMKKEMLIKERRNYVKYSIFCLVGLGLLIGVLYFAFFFGGGDNVPDIDDPDF